MSERVYRPFNAPLSGDVSQFFQFWPQAFANASISLVSIDLGESSNAKVENAVLDKVAGYGKQLGRIGDALAVLIRHFEPKAPLTDKEQAALDALTQLLAAIREIKESTMKD